MKFIEYNRKCNRGDCIQYKKFKFAIEVFDPITGELMLENQKEFNYICRGGSRAAATSKMECFVIIVNGSKPLTIITKHSILDVAAVLDPPLHMCSL